MLLGVDVERLPATGRVMDVVGFVCLEHSDDRVTVERQYWPVLDSAVQLGLVSLDEPVLNAR